MHNSYSITPIARIRTPFAQKFAIPRQCGLAPSAHGLIEMLPPFNVADAFRGLEGFSHIWVIFLFDQHLDRPWSALVRPPRLGGKERVGVFASRSTFRPNMLGQSVFKLEQILFSDGGVSLEVSGVDLLDNTPIVDIKPYIPYSDALPDAVGGFAARAPDGLLQVEFSAQASAQCTLLEGPARPRLRQLITEVLQQDPRPAQLRHGTATRDYGVQLYDLNLRFEISTPRLSVLDIQPIHR